MILSTIIEKIGFFLVIHFFIRCVLIKLRCVLLKCATCFFAIYIDELECYYIYRYIFFISMLSEMLEFEHFLN